MKRKINKVLMFYKEPKRIDWSDDKELIRFDYDNDKIIWFNNYSFSYPIPIPVKIWFYGLSIYPQNALSYKNELWIHIIVEDKYVTLEDIAKISEVISHEHLYKWWFVILPEPFLYNYEILLLKGKLEFVDTQKEFDDTMSYVCSFLKDEPVPPVKQFSRFLQRPYQIINNL